MNDLCACFPFYRGTFARTRFSSIVMCLCLCYQPTHFFISSFVSYLTRFESERARAAVALQRRVERRIVRLSPAAAAAADGGDGSVVFSQLLRNLKVRAAQRMYAR
jgi:hypothetical protein